MIRLNLLRNGVSYQSRRLALRRIASMLVFCLFPIALSGCVYMRLLTIKNQLAKFDQFFKTQVSDSFTLEFLKPTLYGKDIIYLSEMQPSQRVPVPAGEEWTFQFRKMISETETDPTNDADISFLFHINPDDMLTSLTFSPILLRMAPAEFIELSLRSLGGAKVDQKKRQIDGSLENLEKLQRALPKREEILQYLGKPFSEETIEGTQVVSYNYRLETAGLPPEKEKRRLSFARLYFDPKTGELIRFYGKFAGMKISINYRKMVAERFAASDSNPAEKGGK